MFTNPEIEAHGKEVTCSRSQSSSRRYSSLKLQFDALFTCSTYLKVFFGKLFPLLSFGSMRTPSVRGKEIRKETRKSQKSKRL